MHRFLVLLLASLLPVLAACGGAARTASDTESDPAADAPVTITLAYNRFLETSFTEHPAPIDVIRSAVAEAHPNIDVQLNIVPDSIEAHRDALAVWMTSQDGTVDIYGMDAPWVLEFGEAGWAVPLNDYLPDLEERFLQSGLDIFLHEGQRLGVPFWGSVGGMFYRTDLLEAAGFEPPATYDELVEIVAAIQAEQPDLSGFVWPGARQESLIQTWAEIFLGFGGSYYADDGRCAVNSPQGIAAVTFMVELIDDGISPRETTAWTAEEARTRFVEGEAIFLRHNHDIITWLDDPERSDIVGQWAFMPNPAQPGGEPSGATGGFAFAINPYTDSLPAAVQVIQVIASEEVQKGFALAWGPVQYYRGLYEQPEVQAAHANVGVLADVLPSSASRPRSTNYAQLSDILQQEIHSALTGSKSVENALNDACSRIDALPGARNGL